MGGLHNAQNVLVKQVAHLLIHGHGYLVQGGIVVQAPAHQLARHAVRRAEGEPLFGEVIGDVGRAGKVLFRRLRHAVEVQPDGVQHVGVDGQAVQNGLFGVEHALLIFL